MADVTEREFEMVALATAIEGMKAIHAFLVLQSRDTPLTHSLRDKSKHGGWAVSGYTRFVSATTNRAAVALAAQKMKIDEVSSQRAAKRLKA